MEYGFNSIEQRWRKWWQDHQTYKVENGGDKPKCYVLDMFPYPSGAGLHVGHPLGYIASDIYARYKRLRGFNVLHPMGYDAFGLPAEQYALETGQHPAVTTEKNIARYREQLDNIGFSFDWSREVRTSDPAYYQWTQWMFIRLFESYFDKHENKARPISALAAAFAERGNADHPAPGDESLRFSAREWAAMDEARQRAALMQYRLAFLDYAEVWWCEALGTVLANDEVINGVSERGGHPCVRKKMRQWMLRITDYAERLLQGLHTLDWTDAMKDMQRNWIGKSVGAEIEFKIQNAKGKSGADESLAQSQNDSTIQRFNDSTITVFTTRPDTIFGVDFMVLAPEHELVDLITTDAQRVEVADYKAYVQTRSERDRMAETKKITGAFTGAYVAHPFGGNPLPVWISEYVLAGYGTGAIMAVPAGDERDHAFAKHFGIPITNIFGEAYTGEEALSSKDATVQNSDFLSGKTVKEASALAIAALEEQGIGGRRINYRLRDAGFSRQRYWGEPFPVIYRGDTPYTVEELPDAPPPGTSLPENDRRNAPGGGAFHPGDAHQLPVELPHVDSYKPGPEGQGPLANLTDWMQTPQGIRESNTMPGYAGSSWYFLRYADPHNSAEFAGREATDYWGQVDVYVGGSEHAVGHLLYARLFTKVLYDLGLIGFDEPFKKLVNQGMIQGVSHFAYLWSWLGAVDNADGEDDVVGKSNGFYVPITSGEPFHTGFYNRTERVLYSADCNPNQSSETYIPYRIPSEFVLYEGGQPYLNIDVALASGGERTNAIYVVPDCYYVDGKWRIDPQFSVDPDQKRKFRLFTQPEKMSKSKYNVVNPDDIVAQYGADTFRMYEMFLGPIEVSKPWDTQGIEGVHRFLKKLWRLYVDAGVVAGEDTGHGDDNADRVRNPVSVDYDGRSDSDALRALHKALKKIGEDIERFAFNTAVSQFMILVNELTALKCSDEAVLKPLVVMLAPFAPHLAEELWQRGFGETGSVTQAAWPQYDERLLVESTVTYPVAVNGKTRATLSFPADADEDTIKAAALADEAIQKWLEGKAPKKVIFVKGRMVNVVL